MASKICIIGTSNIKHISLISLYTKYFDQHGMAYDIIYLDRYGIEEKTTAANVYRYTESNAQGKIGKLKMFMHFRRYTKKILRENKYEYVITWQTTGAYLFADMLLRWFKNRYVVNVRDYVVENNWFFHSFLKRLVKNVLFVTISSDGFRSFLPKGEYIKVNSVNEDLLENLKGRPQNSGKPIKIGFVGNCRYFRESYKLIDALANDERFELWYCGTNSDVLKEYADSKGIWNVKTMPTFDPKATVDIMAGFDFVNSAFGNDAMDNSTLMPIRLYTALAIHRPMLVSSNTQLAKEVTKGKIGYVIEDFATLAESLYTYHQSLDFEVLSETCDAYLQTARKENEVFYAAVNRMK